MRENTCRDILTFVALIITIQSDDVNNVSGDGSAIEASCQLNFYYNYDAQEINCVYNPSVQTEISSLRRSKIYEGGNIRFAKATVYLRRS